MSEGGWLELQKPGISQSESVSAAFTLTHGFQQDDFLWFRMSMTNTLLLSTTFGRLACDLRPMTCRRRTQWCQPPHYWPMRWVYRSSVGWTPAPPHPIPIPKAFLWPKMAQKEIVFDKCRGTLLRHILVRLSPYLSLLLVDPPYRAVHCGSVL